MSAELAIQPESTCFDGRLTPNEISCWQRGISPLPRLPLVDEALPQADVELQVEAAAGVAVRAVAAVAAVIRPMQARLQLMLPRHLRPTPGQPPRRQALLEQEEAVAGVAVAVEAA